MANSLLVHVQAMQAQAAAYVAPGGYADRQGNIVAEGSAWDSLRDEAFANDMVYMLDGPEERAAIADASFNFGAEALLTLSPEWHGNMVAKHHFTKALNNAIDALNQLDKIKKTLFYGRDNNLEPVEGVASVADMPDHLHGTMIGGLLDFDRKHAELFIHGAIGYATEAGEMLEALKAAINGNPVDAVNVMEESGDGKWYMAILAHAFGYDYTDDERRIIDKLRARFPNRFTEYDANNRDLNAERAILERANWDGNVRHALEIEAEYAETAALDNGTVLAEAVPASGAAAVSKAAEASAAAFAAVDNVGKPYAEPSPIPPSPDLSRPIGERSALMPGERLSRQPVDRNE